MNRFTTNTSFRERTPNYIPLPFDQLYQVLQQKQQNYDAAEDLEIKAKSAVSALSSPVTGYQQYLDGVKENFLTQAMTLHKSTPDKGSPEYNRKLRELIGGVEADRKIQLIEKGNTEYLNYIKDKAKKVSDNKYSPVADFYSSFQGIDEKTGEVLPFTYAGMRDKVDWKKEAQELIKNTPEEQYSSDIQDPVTGTTIKRSFKRKTLNGIMNSFNTLLTPEAIQDMSYELGIKDDKKLNKVLQSIANTGVYNNMENGVHYNFDRLDQTASTGQGDWTNYGETTVDNNKVSVLNDLIDNNGALIPTDPTWSEGYKKGVTFGKTANFGGFNSQFLGGIKNTISGAFEDKSTEYTINRLKEEGIPIDNLMTSAKKLNLPLEQVLSAYKSKAISPTKFKVLPISNEKERNAIEGKLQGTMSSLDVRDKLTNEPLSNEEKTAFALGNIKVAGIVNSNNPLSPFTYAATVAYKDKDDNIQTKQVLIPFNKQPSSEQDYRDLYLHEKEKALLSGNLTRMSSYSYSQDKLGRTIFEQPKKNHIFEITINPLTEEEIKTEVPIK